MTKRMKTSPRQSVEERAKLGKSLRKRAPRTSHAEWPPESARPDPIALLEEQNKDRLDFFKHALLEKKAIKLIIDNGDIEEVEPEKIAAAGDKDPEPQ